MKKRKPGRPCKVPGIMMSQRVTVMMTPSQVRAVKRAAQRRVMDFSEWARCTLLEAALKE